MRANRDRLLEAAPTGFANDDGVGIVRRLGRELRHVEIALGPRVDNVGDVGRVAAAAQEVIGAGERDEAFGMLRRGEDAACIVDGGGAARTRPRPGRRYWRRKWCWRIRLRSSRGR